MIFQLDTAEFLKFTQSKGITVLDIREPEETEQGFIEGAKLRPKSQFANWVSEFKPEETLALYCRSGGRVQMLAQELESRGHKNLVLAVGYGYTELSMQNQNATKDDQAAEASRSSVIFHQIFDPSSQTFSYVVGDPTTKEVALLDSVHEHYDYYVNLMEQNGYKLTLLLETHMHADHVSCVAPLLSKFKGAEFRAHPGSGLKVSHEGLVDGEFLKVGQKSIQVMFTPGHTSADVSFVFDGRMLFSGDCMFINSCGRTDFQGGSAKAMRDSLHKICRLPNETLVYPAHNYEGRTVSSVGQELKNNPLLKLSESEFIQTLDGWNLPKPQKIDFALPANLNGGVWEGSPLYKGSNHEAP